MANQPNTTIHTEQQLDGYLQQLGRRFDELVRQLRISQAIADPIRRKFDHQIELIKHPAGSVEWSSAASEVRLECERAVKQAWCEAGLEIESQDEVADAIDPVVNAIWRVPAASVAGLAVKARVATFQNASLWEREEGGDYGVVAARNLIENVAAIAARL